MSGQVNGVPEVEPMNRYRITALLFALAALIFLVYPQQFSNSSAAAGQKRHKRSPRRVATPQSTGKPRVDYSNFSHATSKHQGACNTCHKVPTDNWKKVRDIPDVADYPGHDACVSCHRPQFFKGANPLICSVCHSKVSPRDDARFAFRNPKASRQFLIEFPHDKHQDVIARTLRRFATEKRPLFLRASFTRANASTASPDEKLEHYNNCEICHGPRTNPPVAPATGWLDSFAPDAATFKAVPASHAACFNCHWKSQQPTRENCAGCHKLTDKPYRLFAADDVPQRFSLKFRHAREQHVQECTTCHINITKAATLRGLKPDVPITSCTPCHNKDGLRQDVSLELQAIDNNRDFVCSYCHISNVGRLDPPFGHYLIAGRKPMQRKDVK
jgi:hypothetical protein